MTVSVESLRPPRSAVTPNLWVGWVLWGIFALVISILVGTRPEAHTVTPEYRTAALNWFRGEDLYHLNNIGGFLYGPSSVLLYWPITLFPLAIGEVLWRLVGIGLLAWAVWKLSRLELGFARSRYFWLITLLTLPACLASARNGQTNLPLSALMILTIVDLSQKKWTRAALWLGLSLLCKPIAMVPILLTFFFYPHMRFRLLLTLLGVAVLPWLNLDWHYVLREHLLFLHKMVLASDPQINLFSDLRGLSLCCGLTLPGRVMTLVRFLLAGYILLLCWQGRRHPSQGLQPEFLLGALNAIYLMLGNPRTETNSYVILAPFLAVLAVQQGWVRNQSGSKFLLTFLVLGLGCDGYGPLIFHATDIWFKPLLTLIFLGYLSWIGWQKKTAMAVENV